MTIVNQSALDSNVISPAKGGFQSPKGLRISWLSNAPWAT